MNQARDHRLNGTGNGEVEQPSRVVRRDDNDLLLANELPSNPEAGCETFGDDTWGEPIPFDRTIAPSFPLDVIPPWLADWAQAESLALQVPVDLPALLGLAVVSLAIAKKLAVTVRDGWSEPTNLYTVIALPPGEGKSPVFAHAIEPVHDWERQRREELQPKIADLLEQRSLLEERRAAARKRATKSGAAADNAANEARELAVELDAMTVPSLPRLVADDATPEAIGMLLAAQGGRMAILSSEGGPFEIMAGRYDRNKAPHLELFLKAHSGDGYTLDRTTRPAIHLRSPLLTLALTVQPSVIGGLAAHPEFRGRGLLARFLYSLPTSKVGRRDANPPSVPAATRVQYGTKVRALLDLPAEVDKVGELLPRSIAFTPGAYTRFVAFKAELEPQLGAGGELAPFADWGAKLPGLVARLAGVLHVAGNSEDPMSPIGEATVVNAIRVGRYAASHARAAFGTMAADPATDGAHRLWAWVTRAGLASFSARDAQRALHAKRAGHVRPWLEVLVERELIRERPRTAIAAKGGRPPSEMFDVNPLASMEPL